MNWSTFDINMALAGVALVTLPNFVSVLFSRRGHQRMNGAFEVMACMASPDFPEYQRGVALMLALRLANDAAAQFNRGCGIMSWVFVGAVFVGAAHAFAGALHDQWFLGAFHLLCWGWVAWMSEDIRRRFRNFAAQAAEIVDQLEKSVVLEAANS